MTDRSFEAPFETKGDGDRLLARSENYTVRASWEAVEAESRHFPTGYRVYVGDFYGNPAGAVIGPCEHWIAMWGAGLIVYWLVPPFEGYVYDRVTSQYLEWGRDSADIWWITAVEVEDPSSVRFVVEEGDRAGAYRLLLTEFRPRPVRVT